MKSGSANHRHSSKSNCEPDAHDARLPFWERIEDMKKEICTKHIYLCGEVNSRGNNQKKLVILPEKKTNQNCHSVFYYVFIENSSEYTERSHSVVGAHSYTIFYFIRYVFIRMLLSHFIFPVHTPLHFQQRLASSPMCAHLCFINVLSFVTPHNDHRRQFEFLCRFFPSFLFTAIISKA